MVQSDVEKENRRLLSRQSCHLGGRFVFSPFSFFPLNWEVFLAMLPPGALVPLPELATRSHRFNAWTQRVFALHILPDGGASGLALFLASAAADFPFTARVRMMHHRETTHIKTGASPVTIFCPSAGQTLLLSGGNGGVIFYRQTGRQREIVDTPALLSLHVHFPAHLFCFLYHFNVSLWHIAASQPAGAAARRRAGGEVEGIMTDTG